MRCRSDLEGTGQLTENLKDERTKTIREKRISIVYGKQFTELALSHDPLVVIE